MTDGIGSPKPKFTRWRRAASMGPWMAGTLSGRRAAGGMARWSYGMTRLAPLVAREAAHKLGGHYSGKLTANPAGGGHEARLQRDRYDSRLASHRDHSVSRVEALLRVAAVGAVRTR